MKNPLKITQDVLNGMIGIVRIRTNQEFYDEFTDRLKEAMSLHNVVGKSVQEIKTEINEDEYHELEADRFLNIEKDVHHPDQY